MTSNPQMSPRSERRVVLVPHPDAADGAIDQRWYAVYTYPQHEKTSLRHLLQRGVDAFHPTYVEERVWKNRQRVKLELPLFPSYLFVRIPKTQRGVVLGSPGVLRLLGSSSGPEAIPDSVINVLRGALIKERVDAREELVAGQRVRIRRGAMQGLEGNLVRKKNSLWFVLSVDLINQRAMVEVRADDVEPVPA